MQRLGPLARFDGMARLPWRGRVVSQPSGERGLRRRGAASTRREMGARHHDCGTSGDGQLPLEGLDAARTSAWAVLVVLLVVSTPAMAFELNSGVNMGGALAGTIPRFAVSPSVGISWRTDSGLMFGFHGLFCILPPIDKVAVGVYNQTAASIGYASKEISISAGPSFSVYSMPACGPALCGRVTGLAPGAHAQVTRYIAGPWGVSVIANVDWIGGKSLVLHGGFAAMVVAGPVLRWSNQ
jgi:hypothetical protein